MAALGVLRFIGLVGVRSSTRCALDVPPAEARGTPGELGRRSTWSARSIWCSTLALRALLGVIGALIVGALGVHGALHSLRALGVPRALSALGVLGISSVFVGAYGVAAGAACTGCRRRTT